MHKASERWAFLWGKYIQNTCSRQELNELLQQIELLPEETLQAVCYPYWEQAAGAKGTGPSAAEWSGSAGITSTTAPFEFSDNDVPKDSRFIITNSNEDPYDWRKPQNNSLWQGVSGINNPCPSGWRLATTDEWAAEKVTNLGDAYTKLKVTITGAHNPDGSFDFTDRGRYWTSTTDGSYAIRVGISNSSGFSTSTLERSNGFAVKCIKNSSLEPLLNKRSRLKNIGRPL